MLAKNPRLSRSVNAEYEMNMKMSINRGMIEIQYGYLFDSHSWSSPTW